MVPIYFLSIISSFLVSILIRQTFEIGNCIYIFNDRFVKHAFFRKEKVPNFDR